MSFFRYNIRLVLGGTQTGYSNKQFPIFAIMFSSEEPVSLRSCQILAIPIRDQEGLRRRDDDDDDDDEWDTFSKMMWNCYRVYSKHRPTCVPTTTWNKMPMTCSNLRITQQRFKFYCMMTPNTRMDYDAMLKIVAINIKHWIAKETFSIIGYRL